MGTLTKLQIWYLRKFLHEIQVLAFTYCLLQWVLNQAKNQSSKSSFFVCLGFFLAWENSYLLSIKELDTFFSVPCKSRTEQYSLKKTDRIPLPPPFEPFFTSGKLQKYSRHQKNYLHLLFQPLPQTSCTFLFSTTAPESSPSSTPLIEKKENNLILTEVSKLLFKDISLIHIEDNKELVNYFTGFFSFLYLDYKHLI